MFNCLSNTCTTLNKFFLSTRLHLNPSEGCWGGGLVLWAYGFFAHNPQSPDTVVHTLYLCTLQYNTIHCFFKVFLYFFFFFLTCLCKKAVEKASTLIWVLGDNRISEERQCLRCLSVVSKGPRVSLFAAQTALGDLGLVWPHPSHCVGRAVRGTAIPAARSQDH